MSEVVDQVSEAVQNAPVIAADQPAAKEPEEPAGEDEAKPSEPEPEVPFPKKAINAISRRDKQIGKLKAELAQARATQTQVPQGQTKQPDVNAAPNEDDFDNYGEFLKATARYEARQELAEGNKKQVEAQTSAREEQWVEERSAILEDQATKLIEQSPELRDLLIENLDLLDSFPQHLEHAFLDADDGALAFAVLAKEGKLESLLSMSPARAIMEIGRAQDRGGAIAKTKTVTNAPAPMRANKGNSPAGDNLNSMSGADILKAIRK